MPADIGLQPVRPLHLAPRFPLLHQELMTLLRGLSPADWTRPTSAGRWTVKDVAAHLLDTALRRLSVQRDGLVAPADRAIESPADLVAWLDRLNAVWVEAATRLSPGVLLDLLDDAGPRLSSLLAGLDPEGPAIFPVAWAGEAVSPNWFDVAREYTERWIHQQQIRDAVGAPGLVSPEWLHPVLDLFLRALPHGYRSVAAPAGTTVSVELVGAAGGWWTLVRRDRWSLYHGRAPAPDVVVTLEQGPAWRLFTKGLSPERGRSLATVSGDPRLSEAFFRTLAIMG